MRWFPDDETQTVKLSIPVFALCAVHADYFFVVFQNLIWGKWSILRNNARNFFSIFVLEIDVLHFSSCISCSSDLLDLGSDFYFLQIGSILVLSQKNWRVAPIRHNYLNGTNIDVFVLPFESNSLDRFVFGHSLQISNTWMPEINWVIFSSEKWKLSECFKTFFSRSANQ